MKYEVYGRIMVGIKKQNNKQCKGINQKFKSIKTINKTLKNVSKTSKVKYGV